MKKGEKNKTFQYCPWCHCSGNPNMKKDQCLSKLLNSTGLLLIKSFKSLMQSLKLFVSLGHAYGYAKTFLNLLLENVSESIRKNISMMI